MQTSQQVIDALLRNKKAERYGLIEGPWAETMARWVREGYPTHLVHKRVGQSRWRSEDGMWDEIKEVKQEGDYEEPVPPSDYFGFDIVGTAGWFDWQPKRGVSDLIEETDEWEIRRNGGGAALKYRKRKSGTPEHVDFLMSSREIWERDYRPHIVQWDPGRMGDLAEARKNTQEARDKHQWISFGHMFIWEIARQTMGDINLYSNLILDPGWIHDFNRVYTDMFKIGFDILFKEVGKPDGIWFYEDMGYKAGLFASPKLFRELIFPYYREMIEYFHSLDLPVLLHSCGSVAEALPLIVDVGFDALHPMERKAKNNDPFAFADKYADKLTFIGGLDARTFESNDKDLLKREITNYIEGMKARGARLVFCSDHSLSPAVSFDTYKFAVDVFHDLMML